LSYHDVPIGRIWCKGNSRTHDAVIIRELLVQPGDGFDLDLIQESERNLRDFSYIGSVEIIPHFDPARNVVDLEVQIRDRFPWVVFPSPSFGGGRFDLSFLAANFNFLGRGQAAGIQGEISSDEADTYIVGFEEPRLGGSRWGGSVVGRRQGDRGEQLNLVVAYELSFFDWEVQKSFYEEGIKTSQYYNRLLGASAGATRSIRSENKRLEIDLTYRYFEERNEQDENWTGVIAKDKRRGSLRLRIGAERFRYVEDTYLFQMGPVEDVKLGPNGNVRLGAALKALGSNRNYPEFGLGFGWFGGSPEGGYAHFSFGSDARIENGDITNHTGNASAGLFYPVGERNLLSWRFGGSFQNRMEDPAQLLLGSGRGLRGFAAQAFDGERLLRTSVEWRQTVWVTDKLTVGYVIFTDAGSIWSRGESIDGEPFLVSVGTGFRLSVPGLIGGPILRLDFAYGIRDDYFDVSLGL
jgi:outer membrane protein assembly factor BamA